MMIETKICLTLTNVDISLGIQVLALSFDKEDAPPVFRETGLHH
jgi:hypothetical protein